MLDLETYQLLHYINDDLIDIISEYSIDIFNKDYI